MKNTKILLSTLLMLLLLTVTACSPKDDTDVDTDTTDTSVTESPTDETSDTTDSVETPLTEDITMDYTTGLAENGYYENVKALDVVSLFDYNGISVPSDVHTVSTEAIESEINTLLNYFSTNEQIMDKAIVDGDTVNIDYVGSIDGVEFAGGNTGGAGTDVTIGVTSYIDDFLAQLIGHMPGESFDIEVTFPEDYGNEELNGKDAIFAITINYISQAVIPELSDAFVSENLTTIYNVSTVDELRSIIEDDLRKASMRTFIQNYVAATTTISSIPENVLLFQENAMTNYYKSAAISYGMSLTDFLTNYVGVSSLEDLLAASSAELIDASNFSLTVQAIAEDANLEVTEEVIGQFFLENSGSADYSLIEAQYGKPYINYSILQETVINYLIDNAVLAE